jgi:hypothetical protein
MGIEFTDAQEAMALAGVNRNLDAYETVRKIDVPLDTEPAFAFHPAHARKELYGIRTSFASAKLNCRNSRLSTTWPLHCSSTGGTYSNEENYFD